MHDGRNFSSKKIMDCITTNIKKALHSLYNCNYNKDLPLQKTNKDFDGDITLVVFPFLRFSKLPPEKTALQIGEYLKKNDNYIIDFNVVKGFLNISITDIYYIEIFSSILKEKYFGIKKINPSSPKTMVEFSSPNTNKPLHLGHLRNILLGHSISRIIEATGKKVVKVQIINDRGIHICKSMIAWQKSKENEEPNQKLKGDKLVGKYYILFENEYKKQIEELKKSGLSEEKSKKKAPILLQAQELLRKWEKEDTKTRSLWKKMNNWVYDGFKTTYNRLQVSFDKNYYESNTYILGKEVIKKGLKEKLFYQKENGSIWCNLSNENLDDKLLLRDDGTSVYMTQDIGTAILRFNEFNIKKQIYVVGNEQNHHFKVLFIILNKLGYNWAKNCTHLSYGMVDLPEGKMKSREGTIVDADDLMEDMYNRAKSITNNLGKVNHLNKNEKDELFEILGMGALKYFILKVDPKKGMLFNPKESVDFNGNTGPFIQYTYARIQSILKKYKEKKINSSFRIEKLNNKEKKLIKTILNFPEVIRESAENLNPALIANYCYQLVKDYNQLYQQVSILAAENEDLISFRCQLSFLTAKVIKSSMNLLGIKVPNQM